MWNLVKASSQLASVRVSHNIQYEEARGLVLVFDYADVLVNLRNGQWRALCSKLILLRPRLFLLLLFLLLLLLLQSLRARQLLPQAAASMRLVNGVRHKS